MKPTSMTNRSWNATKNDAFKQMPKNQKIPPKKLPNETQQVRGYLGKRGAKVLMGSFVAQTVFVIKKWAPSAPKVLPMIEE